MPLLFNTHPQFLSNIVSRLICKMVHVAVCSYKDSQHPLLLLHPSQATVGQRGGVALTASKRFQPANRVFQGGLGGLGTVSFVLLVAQTKHCVSGPTLLHNESTLKASQLCGSANIQGWTQC